MSIKQRTNIPGGICEFDLPSYHYWLHLPPEQQRRDLDSWLAPFLPIRDAVDIVLRLLRASGKSTLQVAHQGMYQQMMTGRVAQMVCVAARARLPVRAGDQREQVRAQHPLHDAGRHAAAQGRRNRRRVRAHVLQPLSTQGPKPSSPARSAARASRGTPQNPSGRSAPSAAR